MANWIQIPLQMPANNDVVWVRTQRWSGAAFLAQYKSAQEAFVDQTNSIDFPAYSIAYWKPQ